MGKVNWSSTLAAVFVVAAITSLIIEQDTHAVVFALIGVVAAIMSHHK